MKKHILLTILTALILALGGTGTVRAEVIPPFGEGQIGLQAVVLCDSLTVRSEPSTSSAAVTVLKHRDLVIITKESAGWAYCVLGDSEDAAAGWVKADYIAIDPAWYRTETDTPVYAWNDTAAPKVALLGANTAFLDPNTFLPILKDEGEWILVSLRGAAGWIYLQNRTAEPAGTGSGAGTERQDGERFEATIMIEGTTEPVRYEHVRNSRIGFGADYDYELFVRRNEGDRERFISVYDDPANPQNYLEVTCSKEHADAVSASVSEALSKDYEISREPFLLDGAGGCVRIEAAAKGGAGTPGPLQTVYIIPAADGCRVAAVHYTFESAEGFGRRLESIVNTLTIINRAE